MSWSVLAVCTIKARIGMNGSTNICNNWILRPRRLAGSVARAQQDFLRFVFAETSSDDRLLTELTSATQDPLRGDMLKLFIKSYINHCQNLIRSRTLKIENIFSCTRLRLTKNKKKIIKYNKRKEKEIRIKIDLICNTTIELH